MRLTIATAESINGAQRKLAWFVRQGRGLYYDAGGLIVGSGSHTSYHVDGNVFRTSPATEGKPRFQGREVPLGFFRGWHQLGVAMVDKSVVLGNAALKPRDLKTGNLVLEVPFLDLPEPTINVVLELIHPDSRSYEEHLEFRVPKDARQVRASVDGLEVVVTVLGHSHNLLISPMVDGFTVKHHNERFSANRRGWTYSAEAYGPR